MASAWQEVRRVRPDAAAADRDQWMAGCLPEALRRPSGAANGTPPRIRVFGLASFLPEISSKKPDDIRTAQDAMYFLIHLALALREQGHPLETIELVAGSRVNGVRADKEAQEAEPLYTAGWPAKPLELVDDLCTNLTPVAERAEAEHLRLAIELEPGPLYILGGEEALLHLCEQLAKPGVLSRTTGINLDVAHWDLAGLTHAWLLNHPEVCTCLQHVHISDHGRGHFGDVALGDCHPPGHFLPWLRAIAAAGRRRPDGVPPMTGLVSIELEACKTRQMLRRSLDRLLFLLELLEKGGTAPGAWPRGGSPVGMGPAGKGGPSPGARPQAVS
jgi:sugar phosphate isomerase/epimerase